MLLLLVFLKDAAHRAQREYRFAVWAQDEPVRDRMDLQVSPALLDAMQNPPKAPAGGSFMAAGVDESAAVEEVHDHGPPRVRVHVEAPPGLTVNPIIAPTRYDARRLPDDLREPAAIRAAADALRAAIDQLDAESSRDAAAAAWHAEPVVRFFCSTYGGSIAGVRVSEDSFIVITAEVPGNELVEVTIAVGPDGTCACKVTTAHGAGFVRVVGYPVVGAGLDGPAGGKWECGVKPAPAVGDADTSPRAKDSRTGSRRRRRNPPRRGHDSIVRRIGDLRLAASRCWPRYIDGTDPHQSAFGGWDWEDRSGTVPAARRGVGGRACAVGSRPRAVGDSAEVECCQHRGY